VPFGLFKKKEAEKNESGLAELDLPQAGATLSIQDTQSLLENIESAHVETLSARLEPARNSTMHALESLTSIADGMEKEKLKLEELEKRFGSNIENTKKMVVSALRREASYELPQVKSLGDAKKFKERMESMINRFGEVTGSHSKMLNYFLKKHASNMKEEFGSLEDLLKDVKGAISAFEQERAPVVRCENMLNTALQKISSSRAYEQAAEATQARTVGLEEDLAVLKVELAALSGSAELAQAKVDAEKLAEAEKKQEKINAQVAGMFSHVSRTLSKYSYGVPRETEKLLRVLTDEPWQALTVEEQDFLEYSQLLTQVTKSVTSGEMQLKDSDKVLQYLASIQSSLPDLRREAASISAEIDSLRRGDNRKAVLHANRVEAAIAQHEEGLASERQRLDQLKKQAAETNAEVDILLKEVSGMLLSITGRQYAVSRSQ